MQRKIGLMENFSVFPCTMLIHGSGVADSAVSHHCDKEIVNVSSGRAGVTALCDVLQLVQSKEENMT